MVRRVSNDLDLVSLLKQIRKDSRYTTFKKIVETAEQRLDIDKDKQEVFALHAGRTARTLFTGKKYNPSSIMEAAANDLQARSRVVEIRVRASHHIETVEKACEALKDYVVTEYRDDVQKFSNESQRNALIRRVQKVAQNLIVDGSDLLNLCDSIIKDIDQASFHLSTLSALTQHLAQGVHGKIH